MEIIFHSHHAAVSDPMRSRAESAVRAQARRLGRVVEAVVRFEEDGPTRRVEILLHAPRRRAVVARGSARFFGPALTEAVSRLRAQVLKRGSTRARARRAPRA